MVFIRGGPCWYLWPCGYLWSVLQPQAVLMPGVSGLRWHPEAMMMSLSVLLLSAVSGSEVLLQPGALSLVCTFTRNHVETHNSYSC